jgi:tetratricopeptide (TPR) repeat protein
MQHQQAVRAVAFRPDGKMILTGSWDGTARLWNPATGKAAGIVFQHGARVQAVAFSPDGKTILTAGFDKTTRLWDAATGKPVGQPLHQLGTVDALAFSPVGKTFLTGSADNTAQLWETATGKAIGEALQHRNKVTSVAFSPDGRRVLTGSEDRTARLWDTATGRVIGKPLQHSDAVLAVAFSPDGCCVLTGSSDATAWLWGIPDPTEGELKRIIPWTEVITGMALDPNTGVIRSLDPQNWEKRRQHLDELGGPPVTLQALPSWHRQEAKISELRGHWFGAAWHLDRLITAEPADWLLYARRGQALAALGRWDDAVADCSKAIEHKPDVWEARLIRGRIFLMRHRWDKALIDLSNAIDLRPDDLAAWHARGVAHAEMGLWDKAAADFATAVQLKGANDQIWHHHALMHLQLGNIAGYRKTCTNLLGQFGSIDSSGKTIRYERDQTNTIVAITVGYFGPTRASVKAWTCSLAPNAIANFGELVQRATQAADNNPKSYMHARAAGAVLYRAGKFEAAVERLEGASDLQELAPSAWLFLAMSHHQLGHADEARRWLDRAAEWMDRSREKKDGGAADRNTLAWDQIPWDERLTLQLLRAEAEELVKGKAKTPKK